MCLYETYRFSVFSVGFSENQRLLELVWGSEDRVICSIYWKMRKNTVILEEHVARSLYYYNKFYRRYTGPLCLYERHRFSLLSGFFLKPNTSKLSFGFKGQGYELNV